MQLHVIEVKPNLPFRTPEMFEETMHEAVLTLADFLENKYNVHLLGTGMHPLLKLDDTGIWNHRHRQIYNAYSQIFNLHHHGWLNIQSFQLNLPYSTERDAVLMHNKIAEICSYLPAISASSPIYEGRLGRNIDTRLYFYMTNQSEIPLVAGDVIPEYIFSFNQYKEEIIRKYSIELAKAGVHKCLLNKDWVNSRGVIFRFDRKALEIRVMDEQECIKSDVALSCFIKALLKGLMQATTTLMPHEQLVKDFRAVIKEGLNAKVNHSKGRTAREVCKHYLKIAVENASDEEKKYFSIIEKRIENGNLSDIIKKEVQRRAQKTDWKEAIVSVYSRLIKSLLNNEPYF